MVEDPRGLREMEEKLRGVERVSIDLEADSYHHYREKICLVQIGTGDEVFIFDPLRLDAAALVPLLADPGVEKIFHDVDYDGKMLLTQLGVKPAPVFDTMVAAKLLGKERVGLADLLEEYFGVRLEKRFQKADWSRRPLQEGMLKYAALDVAYLLSLRDRLEKELECRGRREWAEEEFRRAVEDLEPLPPREASFIRVKGARNLSPRQLAVLQELLSWRERKAEKLDLPTFKVVGTERLLRLAVEAPRGSRELERSGALSPRQRERFGAEILEAIRRGLRIPPSRLPSFPPPRRMGRDLEAERILRRLKEVRDRKARELGMDPGVLLPNAALKELARLKPASRADLVESGVLRGWQLRVLGDELLHAAGVRGPEPLRPPGGSSSHPGMCP